MKSFSKRLPKFCYQNCLFSRCGIDWQWATPLSADSFSLLRRLLKLFPFETLSIEVVWERRRDVFTDWDSYVEWVKAEAWASDRLFTQIKILRRRKVLGLILWEANASQTGRELAIYTEQDQSNPIARACETTGAEKSILSCQNLKPEAQRGFQRLYAWALSFLSSSVSTGTASKRSATIP